MTSRMFLVPTSGLPMKTWNVFVGCYHNCIYCNARKAAETRLRRIDRYRDGFIPHLVLEELDRRFRPGDFIFVAYMGDIAWATRDEVVSILNIIKQFPKTVFLLCTKDPYCFHQWDLQIPEHVYLGTTIETNRDNGLSDAPPPGKRWIDLSTFPHLKKFLSIEPVMDFDLKEMIKWAMVLQPNIVEVGADNYHNKLPEPPWRKIEALLQELRGICPNVVEKPGLERLRRKYKRGGQR